MDTYSGIKFWEQIQLNWNKQDQQATNNASIMCSNGGVGCGVGGKKLVLVVIMVLVVKVLVVEVLKLVMVVMR